MDFVEFWRVSNERALNTLISCGWKFIRIIQEEKDCPEYGIIRTKWVRKTDTSYLLGRPKEVPAREDCWESIRSYAERVLDNK